MARDGTAKAIPAALAPPARGLSRGVSSLERLARRRSTIGFVMTLPLILVIAGLVAWPAAWAIYLSTLNRRMTASIGLDNDVMLLGSETFRTIIRQSCFFAVTAMLLKALIDGATWPRMLWKIFIPVALPGIIAATIFAFTVSWAAFVYPTAFITKPDQMPLTIGIVTQLVRRDTFA